MPTASTIILIPARMASERLPGKPLADLNGVPMIVEVMRRGEETGLGTVMVAAAESNLQLAQELIQENHPDSDTADPEAIRELAGTLRPTSPARVPGDPGEGWVPNIDLEGGMIVATAENAITVQGVTIFLRSILPPLFAKNNWSF